MRERTVICSAHFVDGKKSEDIHSPSYIPTIFPGVNNQQKSPTKVVQSTNTLPKSTKRDKTQEDCRQMIGSTQDTSASDFLNPEPGPSKNSYRSLRPKQTTMCTQTDISIDPYLEDLANTALSINSEEKQNENECMKKKCKDFYGYVSIETEEQLIDLTGVTIDIFSYLLEMLPVAKENEEFSNKDKLVIFLMKMKIGLTDSALGVFFVCAPATISCIFKNILDVLYEHRETFVFWPDKQTVLATLPITFKDSNYSQCRVILNCLEFSVEKSLDNTKHLNLISNDKQTVKVVYGTTPSGFICFATSCCGGQISDTEIALNSSLPSKLEPGDMVMVVKGFSGIHYALCEQRLVNLPPFPEDTKTDLFDERYSSANVRLHVEETIQRLNNYNILYDITVDLLPNIDTILQVVVILCNLEKPLK
ncbi:hypothetical protein B566_EDAN003657 [Ephemera danica]|nr:hypothetical protein B566_EDAN003657 [Ephemera danica]